MSIIIESLSKSYNKVEVLKYLSFEISPGQCYCLLGKNGAGKSTLLNIISDLILPDSGSLEIFGYNYQANSVKIKEMTGILPEQLPLINELTGIQYLKLIGLLYSVDKNILQNRIDSLITYFFDETTFLQKRIECYSKGMKMKIAFCSILLHKPSILILDEPFNGWDPVAVNLLIEFLNSFLDRDRIILISSHDLLYIDKIATHIGVLDRHNLVFSSTLENFKAQGNLKIEESLLKILQFGDKNKSGLRWVLEK